MVVVNIAERTTGWWKLEVGEIGGGSGWKLVEAVGGSWVRQWVVG